jgi:hypothetical protein
LDKVVKKGDDVYFVTKDKELENSLKLTVPFQKLEIKDENIPNLKNLLPRLMKGNEEMLKRSE